MNKNKEKMYKFHGRPSYCQCCGKKISPNFYCMVDGKWLCWIADIKYKRWLGKI